MTKGAQSPFIQWNKWLSFQEISRVGWLWAWVVTGILKSICILDWTLRSGLFPEEILEVWHDLQSFRCNNS